MSLGQVDHDVRGHGTKLDRLTIGMHRLGMTVEANPWPDPFYLQTVGSLRAEDHR